MQRLNPAFSGGALARVIERFKPASGRLRVIRGLMPYVWPSERPDLQTTVIVSLVLMLAAKLVTVAMPFAFKWATDALVAASGGTVPPGQTIAWLVGAPVLATVLYGATRIAMTLLVQVREGMFARVAMHAVRKLALNTFEHMHGLSLRFHLERKTGGLTRVLERGRLGIENISRMTLMTFVPTIVEFALVLAVLMYEFDWRYAAIVTGMIVLYLGYTVRATDWRIRIRRTMNESDTDASTKAIDSLLNYETVKYFGAEQREARRYDKSMALYEEASIKSYTSLAVLNTGQAVIFTVGLTACMVMAGLDVAAGDKTVGHFVMVNALMLQLFIPLNFMGMVYREIKQSLTDIERMMDVLAEKPEVEDRPGALPLKAAGATIRFENVQFRYEPQRLILGGLSFEVPAGKMVAIVGPSGAGKSTVSRILLRFYDVAGGRVAIDGQDIRDVTQASLRAAIGVVPQDTVLFNDTILYNIRYGRPDAADEEVRAAARMAQIDEFIKRLPDGYNTMVGERGLKLSGGEKQRVAIARTILKAPPILILDEATSALDSHTEKEIQDALDRIAQNRTTLVIAHRLSTIIGADNILVLDAGRLVEQGTHAELLAMNGLYASLWNRQRQAEKAREELAQALEQEKAIQGAKITAGRLQPNEADVAAAMPPGGSEPLKTAT
ncbi:MAG: ABC transporter ATP-binding protein/permease [Hyphomicrobiaceae bacterium]|nr:MAG: ABC transporter ATP-binding protein/permease [Hyphomicrobiaceae bacterium]